MSLSQRRALIDPNQLASIRLQCQWLGLHRSAYYRTGGPVQIRPGFESGFGVDALDGRAVFAHAPVWLSKNDAGVAGSRVCSEWKASSAIDAVDGPGSDLSESKHF
nr:hypothetical protein [Rudanella lutea]